MGRGRARADEAAEAVAAACWAAGPRPLAQRAVPWDQAPLSLRRDAVAQVRRQLRSLQPGQTTELEVRIDWRLSS